MTLLSIFEGNQGKANAVIMQGATLIRSPGRSFLWPRAADHIPSTLLKVIEDTPSKKWTCSPSTKESWKPDYLAAWAQLHPRHMHTFGEADITEGQARLHCDVMHWVVLPPPKPALRAAIACPGALRAPGFVHKENSMAWPVCSEVIKRFLPFHVESHESSRGAVLNFFLL